MPTLEFHCHTVFSKDCLTSPERLLAACRQKGIDRVVITDHNTTAGAKQAHSLDPERVIVGEEVMTTGGELLAAFVVEEVPPGLEPQEAIARLRAQDAFISVSHPFDRFRKGAWSEAGLLEIVPLVDAVETFNARCIMAEDNLLALDFARQHGLTGTAGSDAHVPFELGKALMVLPEFENTAGLRLALGQARMQCSLSPAWIHFTSRWAVWVKKHRARKK